MARLIRVCDRRDVPVGEVRGFRIAELAFPVLIAHVREGQYLASSSICPHEDVSLLDGDLQGPVITCPGHGYEFDLTTGRCPHDAALRLRRFPIHFSGEAVLIELDLYQSPY